MMRTLMIAATLALALSTGAHATSAGEEFSKAVGVGGYIHPTGPVNGVWRKGGY